MLSRVVCALYTENWSDARSRVGVSTQPVASPASSVVQLKKEQHSISNILFASMSSQQIAVQEVEENHGVMILTTRKRGRRKKNRNDVEKNIPNKVYGHRFSNDENIKQQKYLRKRALNNIASMKFRDKTDEGRKKLQQELEFQQIKNTKLKNFYKSMKNRRIKLVKFIKLLKKLAFEQKINIEKVTIQPNTPNQ